MCDKILQATWTGSLIDLLHNKMVVYKMVVYKMVFYKMVILQDGDFTRWWFYKMVVLQDSVCRDLKDNYTIQVLGWPLLVLQCSNAK